MDPPKRKRRKNEEKKTEEGGTGQKNSVEDHRSGRGFVNNESLRKRKQENQEEPDGKRKSSEFSRLRTTTDADDRREKTPTKVPSTEGVSRVHSAEKRNSGEATGDSAPTKTPSEQPRPSKRSSEGDERLAESKHLVEAVQPEPFLRTEGCSDGRTKRESAERGPEEVSSSGEDEAAKRPEVSEKTKRERSFIDNEIVVPVKVESSAIYGGEEKPEAEPQEMIEAVGENLRRDEPSGGPEENLRNPDLILDSVVELKPEPKLRTTETDGKTRFGQLGLFAAESPVPYGVPADRRSGRIQEELRRSEVTDNGSKGIKVEDIKIEETSTHSSVLAETSKQEDDTAMETALPPMPIKQGKFEIPFSGLTPISAGDVAVTSHQIFSSSRSSAKDNAERRPGSRQTPSPTKQPGEGTMAIFGVLRGLQTQRPGPDVVPTVASAPSSPVEAALPPSTVNHVTHSAQSISVASTNSSQSSGTKDGTEQSSTKLRESPESSPSKLLPTTQTTHNETTQIDTSAVREDERFATNGVDLLINENDFKPKSDRNSKLPIKGSTGSSITSPSKSTSDSTTPSSIPPTSPSHPPPSTKPSDSTQSKDSKSSPSSNEIEKTKAKLVDLSEENKHFIDSHSFHPNTRTKLLQAVDRWFTGTKKEGGNTSRVMVVSGRPGIGKTCLAAELCRRYSSKLVGEHFFQFQPRRLDQNFARTMMLSIARKLAEVIPGCGEFLPAYEDLRQLLDEGALIDLFDALIVRPLRNLTTDKRYLIVIDAVDECWQSDRQSFVQLIDGFNENTADCVYLFCTMRDDNHLTGQMERVQLIELKGSSDAMTSDIKRFLRDPMSRLIDRISLDGALAHLSQHSEGSFLAAHLLKKKLESYPDGIKLSLRDVGLFPSGFADICKGYFQQFFDHLSKKYSAKEAISVYSGVVGILALAKDKLSPAFVKQVHAGLDEEADLEPLRGILDVDDAGAVGLHHRSIAEWLFSEHTAAPLAVAPTNARQKMSEAVLVWLAPILELSTSNPTVSVPDELRNYALKHALEHLTDVPKNQDGIAGLLCSLAFVEKKLELPGVTIEDLLNDYHHHHYQVTGAASKLVTLEAYMKRYVDLAQQIQAYSVFVRRKRDQIAHCPSQVLQIAANYPTVSRIQQNAQNDLLERPWLEDLTAVSDSPSIRLQVNGVISQSDLSSDGRHVAILTQDKQQVFLYLLNIATREFTGDALDISNIRDRRGLCVRFLPDNNHLFVGSLSTFVSLKTWKPITSTLDCQSLQLKEDFAIECCDASGSTLACGLSTLPWNGRTLYLAIYDLKTKKAKVIEVHSFRFGGSAQFGIKAVALSQDGGLVSTCVKHQKKAELKVSIWNTGTSKQLYTVDLENDGLSRCFFPGNQSLLISGGSGTPERLQRTYIWSFQGQEVKQLPDGNANNASVAHARGDRLTVVHRYQGSSQFVVSRWRRDAGNQSDPDERLVLGGLEGLGDMIATEKNLIFLSRKSIKIYQFADLTAAEDIRNTSGSFAKYDSIVESVGFFPRSDDPIVVHRSSTTYGDVDGPSDTVSRVSVKSDGTLFGSKLSTLECHNEQDGSGELRCFQGEQTASNVCSCTSDGSTIVMNNGCSVMVLDVASGTQRLIPNITDMSRHQNPVTTVPKITCVLSQREPLMGIIYSQKPKSLYIFDLRSKTFEPSLELKFDAETPVTDFAFNPNNGNILTYHAPPDQSLIVWNQRTGVTVNKQVGVDVVYIRQSPSSDRLVMSLRSADDNTGSLVLRNSDNRFNVSLTLPQRSDWVPHVGCGDVEFSGDGTVLLGLFIGVKVVRVWNIGNGEVLKDIEFGFVGSTSELVGMLTNTHALISDGLTLNVFNVESGEILVSHHSSDEFCSKYSRKGLRISPKGLLIAGSTKSGAELRLFLCHGLTGVKRKTTLQLFRNK